jgi:hypothetical protein
MKSRWRGRGHVKDVAAGLLTAVLWVPFALAAPSTVTLVGSLQSELGCA